LSGDSSTLSLSCKFLASLESSKSFLLLFFEIFLALILFLELILEGFNVALECLLLEFVVCFKGQDLIVGFLREALSGVGDLVELLGVITHGMNITNNVFICAKLIALLFSHNIDVCTKTAVLSLDVIVAD
jgi:hypothetical protein